MNVSRDLMEGIALLLTIDRLSPFSQPREQVYAFRLWVYGSGSVNPYCRGLTQKPSLTQPKSNHQTVAQNPNLQTESPGPP